MANAGAFERLGPLLEAALKRRVGDSTLPLYEMLRYHFGWVDERKVATPNDRAPRTHGLVSLLAAESLGKSPEQALPAAAATEFASASAEIQNDLRLGAPRRGDRPALWWLFGHAQGINAADGVYSLARLSIMDMKPSALGIEGMLRCLAILDGACLRACIVRAKEIELDEETPLASATYLKQVEGEHGTLLEAAASIGSACAGASPSVAESFAVFGSAFGTAQRLRQELDTLWDAPNAGEAEIADILDKRRSLPLLYTMERASAQDLETINALARREHPIDDVRARQLLEIMEKAGARTRIDGLLGNYASRAIAALRSAGVKSHDLEAMAQGLGQPNDG